MTIGINETHDLKRRSWVESANQPETDFPIQNLPFGVFRHRGSSEPPRIGVAIGTQILDLAACSDQGLLQSAGDAAVQACREPALNGLMALGPRAATGLRRILHSLLSEGSAQQESATKNLTPIAEAELFVPAHIGGYTDFYASIHHATNVGRLFRPENPLLPNYKYVPIAYHGRASSIVVSGMPVVRPSGQQRSGENPPVYAPSRRLDYELEAGFYIAAGNPMGTSIPIAEAGQQIFGFCLVNDWSARDVQAWEYQPLGPFLGKNFATTASPWVVTMEALAPFHAPALVRSPKDPKPLPYLNTEADQREGALSIELEVLITTAKMRGQGTSPHRLSRVNFNTMYWTPAQMVAHHASNGCNLEPGDLLASGTVSGPTPDSLGSLLEISQGGRESIALPGGEARTFLEDGDEIILRGECAAAGYRRIGFGECRGLILPARASE
jgi:fumarylacetoacetase